MRQTPPLIRQASFRDLPGLLSLEFEFPPTDRFSRRTWRRLLAGNTGIIAAEAPDGGGLLAAAAILYRRGSTFARIYSLAVAPAARGRGLGARLIDAAASDARGRGCDRLRLEVRSSNHSAIALYARSGFRVIERLAGYYDDGEDALRMEKTLTDAGPSHR